MYSMLGSMEDDMFDTSTPLCSDNDDAECVIVDFVMRDNEEGVLSATPTELLEDIIPRLDKVMNCWNLTGGRTDCWRFRG